MSAQVVRIRLEPLSIEFEAARDALLAPALAEHGLEFPCGGEAICGGCGVRVLAGSLPVTSQDRELFSTRQLDDGWRLACQARAEMPLVLECGQWHMDVLTDATSMAAAGKPGLGIAIDLGTTTIAAQIVDMTSGNILGVETMLNPQAAFGSDVMSRIRSVLGGADLTTVVRSALRAMIVTLAAEREREIAEIVLVGNTVMHHLFRGPDVEPLSHVPFASPHLDEQRFKPRELDWPLDETCTIRFAHCLGGFVGADILAGIVACGMAHSDDLVALVDLGTNGESRSVTGTESSAPRRRRGRLLKPAPFAWECAPSRALLRTSRLRKAPCTPPSWAIRLQGASAAAASSMQWRLA